MLLLLKKKDMLKCESIKNVLQKKEFFHLFNKFDYNLKGKKMRELCTQEREEEEEENRIFFFVCVVV